MRSIPWMIVLAFLMSGCAGTTSSPAAPASSSTVAPPPTANAESGSISGTVTDEERVPIRGADVALVRTQTTTKTDDVGVFTFNDLPPGSYPIVVIALGYKEASKRVEVTAGEVADVRFALASVPIAQEARIVPMQRNVFFNVDNGQLGFNTVESVYANNSVLTGVRCNPCYAVIHFEEGAVGIQSEVQHTGTYVTTTCTPFIIMRYVRNWTDGSTGSPADSTVGTTVYRPVVENKGFVLWPQPNVKEAKKAFGKMKIHYFICGTAVAVNLKVESWTIFSYNAPLPEDYRYLSTAP